MRSSTRLPIAAVSRALARVAVLGLAGGVLGAVGGCEAGAEAPAADAGELEGAEAVLPGKADDYLSPVSREYALWGLGGLTLDPALAEADDAAREAAVVDKLGHLLKAYTYFINEYVTDKSSHDENKGYGGFAGLVRGTSLDWVYDAVDDTGLEWAFIWELEMGGPRDLMDRLPLEFDADGSEYFLVTLPELSDSELARNRYPRDFDPAVYEGETEEIEVLVDPKDESVDSYPDYGQLFEDGVIDVFIAVGGDYNDERYDLKSAQSHFEWLKAAGYEHPASEWTELTLESPPFVGSMDANGAEIRVEITLVHPDIVADADLDQLRARIVQAYETNDVVIYDGHAGQDPDYSGVVYHYNPRRAISATELGELALPERYQVYVFNGCKTYSAYPEAVMKNEAKTTANLDIVSTVNFSWLTQQTFTTSGFLRELLTTRGGTHDPHTWREVLTRINTAANHNVYYGVHGIDDNAHLNPYADLASLCESCKRDADCPGAGNLCVRLGGGSICGAECTANDGCPSGYVCGDIAVGGQITGRQCLPVSFSCE